MFYISSILVKTVTTSTRALHNFIQVRVLAARGPEHGEADLLLVLRAARPQGGHERLRQQEEGQVGGQVRERKMMKVTLGGEGI